MMALSPDTTTVALTGSFRPGNIREKPVESATMSYSSTTLSLAAGITLTCHLPARSLIISIGGGGGTAAAVVSAAGVSSFFPQATSTTAQQSKAIRRIQPSPGVRYAAPARHLTSRQRRNNLRPSP